jgi:hypothetical protein
MGARSKYEYLKEIRMRYKYASKVQKKTILDEFCAVCGYNRKYAIRLLSTKQKSRMERKLSKRGRKKVYHDPMIIQVLKDIWVAANLPCAKRLKTMLPVWLPHYENYILSEDVEDKLLRISPATIDRLMDTFRNKYTKRGLTTTKPGSIIKKRIPVKTNQWDETIPGFIEADAVAHCGDTTEGQYVNTINCVDIASGWTEQRAVWGKGQRAVLEAIRDIEAHLPFPLKGFDSDNGSEFLNWHLVRYLDDRKRPVQFTRARAYHKNDNAHIENKNWTHIRQYIGYQRFQHPQLAQQLNDIYTSEWNDFFNFFIPSVKLVSKHREGAKIIKVYDKPKTPVQRLLESEKISTETKTLLSQKAERLNPFHLQQQLSRKIKKLLVDVNYHLKNNVENKAA